MLVVSPAVIERHRGLKEHQNAVDFCQGYNAGVEWAAEDAHPDELKRAAGIDAPTDGDLWALGQHVTNDIDPYLIECFCEAAFQYEWTRQTAASIHGFRKGCTDVWSAVSMHL